MKTICLGGCLILQRKIATYIAAGNSGSAPVPSSMNKIAAGPQSFYVDWEGRGYTFDRFKKDFHIMKAALGEGPISPGRPRITMSDSSSATQKHSPTPAGFVVESSRWTRANSTVKKSTGRNMTRGNSSSRTCRSSTRTTKRSPTSDPTATRTSLLGGGCLRPYASEAACSGNALPRYQMFDRRSLCVWHIFSDYMPYMTAD